MGSTSLADSSALANADLALIRALLTYIVRGERFSDGHVAARIQDGSVYRILQRLRVLREQIAPNVPFPALEGAGDPSEDFDEDDDDAVWSNVPLRDDDV